MRKLLLVWAMLCLCTTLSFAQSKLITGKITDQSGQPVPFATVHIKGSKRAVSADADGTFAIKANPSEVLIITGAGIAEQDVPVGDGTTVLAVKVARKSSNLTEVVVTALGLTSQKDKLATSQSTIKGSDVAESGEVSLLNGMASKASGVQVVSSGGDPGASVYIQIRGQSTITNDLQPLFVIDGIPVYNSAMGMSVGGTSQQSRLSDINPSDIASMEVLKGAAAAALYGTRAANGVILITTKRGKASNGKVNIGFTSTSSLDVLNRTAPLQTTFGQGNGGYYINGNKYSWGDRISDRKGGADVTLPGEHIVFDDGTSRYDIASGTDPVTNPHGGKNDKTLYNHGKDIFHNGDYLDNTISFSGGDDKTVYYASISDLDQHGILRKGADYHRKSFNFNIEKKFSRIVKLSTNFAYSNVGSQRSQQGSNVSGLFLGGLRTPADFNNAEFEGSYVDAGGAITPLRQAAYRNPIGASTGSVYDNPFWGMNRITSTTEVNRALGSFELSVEATPWLSFLARTGVDYYSDDRTDNYPVISSGFPGGQLTIQELHELQVNTDFLAKVNAPLSKDINFNGIIGFNYNNREFENIGVTVAGFILPNAPFDLTNSAGSNRTPFNSNIEQRTTAAYAQLNFDAFDQLFLNITGRGEQASTFSNTFYYPSVALGWQFTKVKGLDNSKTLSFGKLRATFGEVGVQPQPYLTNTYYSTANSNILAESFGTSLDASSPVYGGGYIREQLKGNPNIHPERKTEYEGGADLRFFDNKVSLSGTYYSNKTTGAIFGVAVPATTGFVSTNDNAAELTNKGVEGDLGINWFKSKNWAISSNFTWSKNKNKVVTLKGTEQFPLDGFTSVVSSAVPGYALGEFYGVGYARDVKGKYILDANGFPTETSSSIVLGDPNPDWVGGVTTTVRYKKAYLSFLFDHVQGGQVWNGTKAALTTIGTAAVTGTTVTAPSAIKDYNGNTIAAGTAFRGSIEDFGAGPVALTQPWYNGIGGGFGTAMGPQYFENGTRTRLREIAVGYSISGERFRQTTKLQSIEFSLTGRNIVLWTKYTGIDPETNLTGPTNGRGIDYFNNPSTRSYLFSIKINY